MVVNWCSIFFIGLESILNVKCMFVNNVLFLMLGICFIKSIELRGGIFLYVRFVCYMVLFVNLVLLFVFMLKIFGLFLSFKVFFVGWIWSLLKCFLKFLCWLWLICWLWNMSICWLRNVVCIFLSCFVESFWERLRFIIFVLVCGVRDWIVSDVLVLDMVFCVYVKVWIGRLLLF